MAGATAQNPAGTGSPSADPNVIAQPNQINDAGFVATAAPNQLQAGANTGGWGNQNSTAYALQATSAFIDIQ